MLARLAKLKELKLGLELADRKQVRTNRRCWRRYDGLAMTLDSGLDLLRGLKELRVVGLMDMEVYIDGDREQGWFKEHWLNARNGVTGYNPRAVEDNVSDDSSDESRFL